MLRIRQLSDCKHQSNLWLLIASVDKRKEIKKIAFKKAFQILDEKYISDKFMASFLKARYLEFVRASRQ
jgi:hypothetical protein